MGTEFERGKKLAVRATVVDVASGHVGVTIDGFDGVEAAKFAFPVDAADRVQSAITTWPDAESFAYLAEEFGKLKSGLAKLEKIEAELRELIIYAKETLRDAQTLVFEDSFLASMKELGFDVGETSDG